MGFWRVLYRCGRTIGHLTVGEFTVTGVPLFVFAFLVSSWGMDGNAERRWLGTFPCDNERNIALRKNALRAYEVKSSELIPPGPWSRVGTEHNNAKNVLAARFGGTLPLARPAAAAAAVGCIAAVGCLRPASHVLCSSWESVLLSLCTTVITENTTTKKMY